MKMKTRQMIILLALAATLCISLNVVWADEVPNPYRVVGYYFSYDIYTPQYFITDIPAHQLTHLNYGYVDISANGQCASSDEWADTGYAYPGDRQNERLRGNFKQLKLLKENNPDLQVLMSIGGWEHSDRFSDVALTQESRIRFARSCIAFMRDNNFDGIDLDWRYPVAGGRTMGRPEDAANYTLLIAEFRGQLEYWNERDSRRYLLTMTAPGVSTLYTNYQLQLVNGDLDWFNLTAYGYYGQWSGVAGHESPLYDSSLMPETENREAVADSVNAYLDAGIPADKIVLGVPFFAQAWRNVRPNDFFGLYQQADGVPSGTRPGGILYYGDLTSLFTSDSYTRFFDDEAKAAWMYNPESRIAISYENAESMLYKAAFVRSLGLGGMMAWELSFDDDSHTLLNAITQGLDPQ
jgi:chitinase